MANFPEEMYACLVFISVHRFVIFVVFCRLCRPLRSETVGGQ